MKSFKFRLQKVLNYRKVKEDGLRTELASVDNNILSNKERLDSIQGEKKSFEDEFQSRQGSGIKGWEAALYDRFLKGKSREISEQEEVIEDLRSLRGEKQKELQSASMDRKIMEKLKSKAWKKHSTEFSRWEQKQIDEVAVQGFRRGKKPKE